MSANNDNNVPGRSYSYIRSWLDLDAVNELLEALPPSFHPRPDDNNDASSEEESDWDSPSESDGLDDDALEVLALAVPNWFSALADNNDEEEQEEEETFSPNDMDADIIMSGCVENPTIIDNAYVNEMITTCASAYHARQRYIPVVDDLNIRVWCFNRTGQSVTYVPGRPISGTAGSVPTTPDRTIYIGGEHEDPLDPDFVIYNDVVVITRGEDNDDAETIQVFGYPSRAFPPTVFHTAVYYVDTSAPASATTTQPNANPNANANANEYIFIIGGLGYDTSEHRQQTLVHRLDLGDYSIQRVETSGDIPPPHHQAEAELEGDVIFVAWTDEEENEDGVKEGYRYMLHISDMRWEKVTGGI